MNVTPLALATVTLATSAVMIAAPASAAPASHTRVISSCTTATYKPSSYILTCADANTQIRHATYTSWSPKLAEGRGTYVYNTCTPSCAAGTFKHHPVSFMLYRPKTVGGKKLFTRMSVSYAGLSEVFQLPTSSP